MPDPEPPGMPSTWSAAPYAGVLGSAIVAWKDADRPDVTPVLAAQLARAMAQALADSPSVLASISAGRPLVLVPVPSRPKSVRSRGRWPVAEMLAEVQLRTHRSPGVVSCPALRVKNGGRDQAGLDRADRARNVREAMMVRPQHAAVVDGAPCLLLDDIVTTGSTLAEAARALRSGGASTVVAATVAATVRRTAIACAEGPSDAVSSSAGRD